MSVLDSLRKEAADRRTPPGVASPGESALTKTTPAIDRLFPAADRDAVVGEIQPRDLKTALLIRRTEERLLRLFNEGRLFGTVHTCIGQEWSAVAIGAVMQRGDYLFSNHRGHGHYLALTDDVEGLIAEIMGRQSGTCGGRGGSQHLCRGGFFSNGIQGGIAPVSAGMALGCKLRNVEGIAAVCLGDGTFGEGVVYETMNLASIWRLPLLMIVEDNGIAQSTPQSMTLAGSIEGRARAFDIAYVSSDTWNPMHLIEAAKQAAHVVRHERMPAMLHIHTFRLKAHSKGDDDRPVELVEACARRDPLNRLLELPAPSVADMLDDIASRLDAAVTRAEASAFTDVQTPETEKGSGVFYGDAFDEVRVVDGIRGALSDAMCADPKILMIGEDICDPYGGAFKVTAGLSTRFPGRVLNAPISEAAIVGLGTGLAMEGWLPIVEIMFGDFLLLAADQWVNHAAKFAWMYNDKVRIPLIIRTPMGGYRGYGPTHSQSLEKHLLGVPGTAVWALHHRHCPRRFYESLVKEVAGPTLVIENKQLYTRRASSVTPPGWSLESLKLARDGACPGARSTTATMTRLRTPREPQVTILAYGGMACLAEAAAMRLWNEEELSCELIFPIQIYPLQMDPIHESVRHTGRLVIVEEAQGFSAWGSEVIAQLAEPAGNRPASPGSSEGFDRDGGFRVSRVHARHCPIPASKPAEMQALPDEEAIVAAAIQLVTC